MRRRKHERLNAQTCRLTAGPFGGYRGRTRSLVDGSGHSGVSDCPDTFWWFAASGNKAQRSAGDRTEHSSVRKRNCAQVFSGVVLGRVPAAEAFGFSFFLSIRAGTGSANRLLTFGLVRAVDESRKARGLWRLVGSTPQCAPPPAPPQFPASWNAQPGLPPTATANAASDQFIGNLVLGIFHLAACHWVDTISLKTASASPPPPMPKPTASNPVAFSPGDVN